METKKLCLIIPSLQPGGMERVMSELAGYFCEQDTLQVHIILYGREPEIFYKIPENLIIHRPDFPFDDSHRQIATFRRLLYLRKTVTLIKPDTILSFGEYWNSFVLLSLLGLPYPVFISDRCSPIMEFGTFHKLLRRNLYPRAKGIIAQTEKAKTFYSSHFKHNNIRVIGNPIRCIEDRKSVQSKGNIVLTVGRLIKTKHHDLLIQIFANISKSDWKLVIVGEEALKQKNMKRLKESVESLQMNDRIIFAGNQSDVDSFYLSSRIFAFTSSSEGFPNVIGEAMSAGLPVVAFNCIAGVEDLVQDRSNGFLVTLFDCDEFGMRLKQLMEDEELQQRLGTRGKEIIRNNYSIETIGKKYYDFVFKN